jgi:glycerophosphoryl diester phosphodiesterase
MRLLPLIVAIAGVACSVVRHPTPAGNCPRSPERVAKVEQLLVIGHRGAATKEVENTIPAMQRAVADGANAVEIDLSLTKDGFVVLWHDWDPNATVAIARQTDNEPHQYARPRVPPKGDAMRRPVDELTLAEVRQHYGYTVGDQKAPAEIPTLEQFFDWAMNERALAYVLFDVKVPKDRAQYTEPLFTKVLELLAARRPSWGHVFLTPHESVYERASAIVPDDTLSFDLDPGVVVLDTASCEDASSTRAVRRGKGHASTVIPKGIGPEAWNTLQKVLSCDLTARDRSTPPVPKKVMVATTNDREQIECLLDMGLDGIVSDDPGALRRITTERGRRP